MSIYEVGTSNPDDRDHAFIEADSAATAYAQYLAESPLTVLNASDLDASGEAHITVECGLETRATEDMTIIVWAVSA